MPLKTLDVHVEVAHRTQQSNHASKPHILPAVFTGGKKFLKHPQYRLYAARRNAHCVQSFNVFPGKRTRFVRVHLAKARH